MANVTKLTDKVTEKLNYLKDLAGVDDSIIDQETKKEIASAVSTIEQELSKVNEASDEECTADMFDIVLKPTRSTPVLKESNSLYASISMGAEEWREPVLDVKNLRRLSSDSFELADESVKRNYSKYYMCFKDFMHQSTPKSAFCNLISIIAYNALHAIDKESLEELEKSHVLGLKSRLAYSGLFLYKSSDDANTCSIYEPDGFLKIMIPKNVEDTLIKNNPRKAEYSIAKSMYPTLNGVIMTFNDMKSLLLNPKCIVYPSLCNVNGMHDMHTLLHRDTTNNNLIYQDINMSDDVVLDQYRL